MGPQASLKLQEPSSIYLPPHQPPPMRQRMHDQVANKIARSDEQRLGFDIDTLLALGMACAIVRKNALAQLASFWPGELREFEMLKPIFKNSEAAIMGAAGIYNNHPHDSTATECAPNLAKIYTIHTPTGIFSPENSSHPNPAGSSLHFYATLSWASITLL